MDQPDIAPLARRLAEENNVDWRRLNGSGDDGRVVERDVLEYLARVMAGEEAVDPTPEPVPLGMEAWPEDDVRAFAGDDDVDEAAEATSTVEDDIFLFDETPAGEAPRPEAAATGFARGEHPPQPLVAAPDDDDVDEEDLLVAGDAEPPAAEPTPEPEPYRPSFGHRDDTAAAAASESALPDLFAADGDDEPSRDTPPPVFGEDAEAGSDAWSTPDWRSGPSLDGEAAETAPERTAADELRLDHDATDAGRAIADATDAAASGDTGSLPDGLEPGGFEDDLELEEVAGDEPLLDPDDPLEGVPSLDEPVSDAASEAPLVVPPPVATTDEGERAAVPSALPLLSHGHVWRRQVDLSALVAAQADLALELGRDAPVPLGAFLVRAAHKAVAGAGFVALAVVQEADVRTVPLPVVGDFASMVNALSDPLARDDAGEADDGVPALVVADLSEFGVDDAVLRLGSPVLTLGRVLIDNQSGGRRATLALAGDGADGAEAAHLLARIADLLEVPVRLVL